MLHFFIDFMYVRTTKKIGRTCFISSFTLPIPIWLLLLLLFCYPSSHFSWEKFYTNKKVTLFQCESDNWENSINIFIKQAFPLYTFFLKYLKIYSRMMEFVSSATKLSNQTTNAISIASSAQLYTRRWPYYIHIYIYLFIYFV